VITKSILFIKLALICSILKNIFKIKRYA
jgi:hypothetical protein